MLAFNYTDILKRIKPLAIIPIGLCLFAKTATSSAESIFNDPFGYIDEVNDSARPASCSNVNINNEINLINAIDIALCNNPQTNSSWMLAKAAAARVGQAKGNYLPTVIFDGNLGQNFSDRNTNAITAPSYNSTSAGLDVSYLLFDFGSRESLVESTKQQMLQASFNYNSLIQSTVFQVIKNYLDVFTAIETLDALKAATIASEESFNVAKGKFEVGLVTRADTAQAETAYSQNLLAVQIAENELKLANGRFSSLLHLSPSQQLNLAPINPEKISTPLNGEVENYIKQALNNRPDLAASAAREKQFEADVKNADAINYPKISVLGSTANTSYSKGIDRSQNDNNIRLNLSVPLFTGFKNTYNELAAKNALEAAKFDRAQAEDNVKLDVWNTYHNYETSQRTYETSLILVNSATTSEELALGRYKVGKGTLTDALDAQAKLADAKRQWVQARYNTLLTKFDLLRALGSKEWNTQLTPVVARTTIETPRNISEPEPVSTITLPAEPVADKVIVNTVPQTTVPPIYLPAEEIDIDTIPYADQNNIPKSLRK